MYDSGLYLYHGQPDISTLFSLPSYMKDTSDFITKVHSLKGIPQNAVLITLDATLYSNIPHDDGIKACDHLSHDMTKPTK